MQAHEVAVLKQQVDALNAVYASIDAAYNTLSYEKEVVILKLNKELQDAIDDKDFADRRYAQALVDAAYHKTAAQDAQVLHTETKRQLTAEQDYCQHLQAQNEALTTELDRLYATYEPEFAAPQAETTAATEEQPEPEAPQPAPYSPEPEEYEEYDEESEELTETTEDTVNSPCPIDTA